VAWHVSGHAGFACCFLHTCNNRCKHRQTCDLQDPPSVHLRTCGWCLCTGGSRAGMCGSLTPGSCHPQLRGCVTHPH
jgi:hypothetical protein